MSGVEQNEFNLEIVTAQSAEIFLGTPSEAYFEEIDGRVVTSIPLPEDAAEKVVKELTSEQQAALILEALQSEPETILYMDSVFLQDEAMTVADVVVAALRDIVVRKMYEDSRVSERTDANSQKEGELNAELNSKVKRIR